jgi:beta-1,4-mannosyl-glycoprotein beta-1,4-N-acetylglucosaminyltransferase
MAYKILDVFLFYNELELLKSRLEYLGPLVDQFIIAEANIDFSGKNKEFILSSEIIKTLPYSEKVTYHREFIRLNSVSWLYKRMKYFRKKNRLLWKIQDAQRNSTLKPLKKFSANDIVIFSDLDEFPSEEALSKGVDLLKDQIDRLAYSCDQIFYYGNLNNATPSEKFYGSAITHLKTFRDLNLS